jgi:hypothetical protein
MRYYNIAIGSEKMSIKNILSTLVLVSTEAFSALNERILTKLDPKDLLTTIRLYSVYATSLNSLITFATKWSYKQKCATLLVPLAQKTEAPQAPQAPQAQKTTESDRELLIKCLNQLHILSTTLIEFSKYFDRGADNNKETIKTFYDIGKFIKSETEALKTMTDTHSLVAAAQNGDILITNKKAMQQLLKVGGRESPPKNHKVIIGGFDADNEGQVYIGGVEELYIVKEKLLKLQNLKTDLAHLSASDAEKYYTEVFSTILDKMLPYTDDMLQSVIDLACVAPADRIGSIGVPDKLLNEQIKQVDSIMTELFAYIHKRNNEVVVPTLQPLLFSANDNLVIVCENLTTMFNIIDEEDHISLKKIIDDEFESYNNIKTVSSLQAALTTLLKNLDLLTSEGFNPHQRHNDKADIRTRIAALTKTAIELSKSPQITVQQPYVAPCIKKTDLENLDKLSQMNKLLELVNFILSNEIAIMPNYQNRETALNNCANDLREILVRVKKLFAADNKTTCIKRSGLLARTLISATLYPIIASKRALNVPTLIDDCVAVKSRLMSSAVMPALDLVKDKKWYCKDGLCADVLAALLQDI